MPEEQPVDPSPNEIESKIRAIPGVVACTVGTGAISILVAPGAEVEAVRAQASAVSMAFGGPAVQVLVPPAASGTRSRPRLAVVVAAAAAVMAAAIVPIAFRSLPAPHRLELHAAPPAPVRTPGLVSRRVGPGVTVEPVAPYAPPVTSPEDRRDLVATKQKVTGSGTVAHHEPPQPPPAPLPSAAPSAQPSVAPTPDVDERDHDVDDEHESARAEEMEQEHEDHREMRHGKGHQEQGSHGRRDQKGRSTKR